MFAKRLVWCLVALIAVGGLLVSCAPSPGPEAAPVEQDAAPVEEEAVPAEEEAVPVEEEAVPAEEEAVPAEDSVLVAFPQNGPVSDEGWTWSHDQGRLAVEAAFPVVRTALVESLPYSSEATTTFNQFVEDGAQMQIVAGEYADLLYAVSDEHPEIAFLECNGHRQADNLVPYYVEHWDPAYLIGMAAGLMTESNQLGYVGAFPTPSVYANVNAFHLGALAVNPDVKTSVVLVNSFFDPPAATQAANALIDNGVDFLFGIMDEAAYLEVAQERGVWAAMWNTDLRRYGPDAYVSSIMLDWGPFYVSEVQALLDGTWEGNRLELLPITEGVDRDEWGQNVPQDVQEQVDAVRGRMINEGYNPFVGPIYDAEGTLRIPEGQAMTDEELYYWDWAVQGVSGLP